MNMVTIIIAVLAAAAAVFAALFFQDRKDAEKYEKMFLEQMKETSGLKEELARRDAVDGNYMKCLDHETLADFLRKEKTPKVEISDGGAYITFDLGEERLGIDCRRLPEQVIVRKGWNLGDGATIHWDVLSRAAMAVTEGLVMVKTNVDPENKTYASYIVTADRTLGSFRENFNFYISVLRDADRMLNEEYWKIMAQEHPDECGPEEQNGSANVEDVAMKLANMTGGQKKLQS